MQRELSIREPLFRWVQQQTGLYITQVNQDPLLLALKVLSSEQGETPDGYAALLISGQIDPQPFFDAVTTHESFFLRHRRHMEVAITEVIQPLLNKGVRPRVLSAPCAQGEEPYSLAMLLQDFGINPERVEIVGCDIAASSIQQAKQGRYHKYSLRQVPPDFIAHHFRKQKDLYTVHPLVQRSVQFCRINLLSESLARLVPGFHVIFSHNMLIYFDRDTTVQMLGVFERLLDRKGLLFVDTTEVPHVGGIFEGVNHKGVRCFQRHADGNGQAVQSNQNHFPGQRPRPASAIPAPSTPPPRPVATPSAPRATPVAASASSRSAAAAPNIANERRRSAEQAYENKQFAEAIRLYEQLIENHPLWASWARLGKARVLLDSGQEMEALEEAEAAISGKRMVAGVYLSGSDEADANAIIAMVLNRKGMKARMAEHLERVRKLNPRHEVLRLGL